MIDKEKYLKDDNCPFCGSDNCREGSVICREDRMIFPQCCGDCGKAWYELYTLAEVKEGRYELQEAIDEDGSNKGMTVFEVSSAFQEFVIDKLKELWPEKDVVFYKDSRTDDTDCFLVELKDVPKNYGDSVYTIQISYYQQEFSGKAFFDWGDRMFEQFDEIIIGNNTYTVLGIRASIDEWVGVISFSIVVVE